MLHGRGGEERPWEEMPWRLIWGVRMSWPYQKIPESVSGRADSKHGGSERIRFEGQEGR